MAIAWNEQAAGCIVDYDFFEFLTEGRAAADCELKILEGLFAWYEAQEACPYMTLGGEALVADLTLIDTGWKEETWNIQPVQHFCGQVGFNSFLPSKGMSPYTRPQDSQRLLIGDHWHVSFQQSLPTVLMNSDHWKLKVHEGFLSHLSYSKHILAETWESRFVPGFKGMRTGWWKSPKPNHYFDATYQAIVARSMRRISVLAPVAVPLPPIEASIPETVYEPAEARRNRW